MEGRHNIVDGSGNRAGNGNRNPHPGQQRQEDNHHDPDQLSPVQVSRMIHQLLGIDSLLLEQGIRLGCRSRVGGVDLAQQNHVCIVKPTLQQRFFRWHQTFFDVSGTGDNKFICQCL